MAQVLQLPHLVEHHGVANMDVGCSRIQPQLHAQRLARGLRTRQFFDPFVLRQQLLNTAQRDFESLSYTIRQRICCNSRLIHKGFLGCLDGMHRYTSAHIAVADSSRPAFSTRFYTVESLQPDSPRALPRPVFAPGEYPWLAITQGIDL